MRLADDRLEGVEIDVGVQTAVDRHRRTERTVSEAEPFFYFDRFTGREFDGSGMQTGRAASLAGLGTAHLDDGTDRCGGAKVLVETDDSVHFGDRQVEDTGEQRNALVIDVAEVMLDRVQRRHQPARPLAERLYERVQFALGRNDIHGSRSYAINGTIEPRMALQLVTKPTSAVLTVTAARGSGS